MTKEEFILNVKFYIFHYDWIYNGNIDVDKILCKRAKSHVSVEVDISMVPDYINYVVLNDDITIGHNNEFITITPELGSLVVSYMLSKYMASFISSAREHIFKYMIDDYINTHNLSIIIDKYLP